MGFSLREEVHLSVGSSTFTLGTRKLHEDQDRLRLSPLPFPWGSLGQAGSLTVQLYWAIQTGGVDLAPLGFRAPLGGLYQSLPNWNWNFSRDP